jgi:bifunctional UDP-N-acetylglucosamine pyrophosphorylase/glucosamine-1-phosphate N-acetyltransferase
MTNLSIIILAAGAGSRMQSNTSKALIKLGNVPLIDHLLNMANKIHTTQKHTIVVASPKDINLEKHITNNNKFYSVNPSNTLSIAYQETPLGSGHAVMSAKHSKLTNSDITLILYVDTPLIPKETLEKLIEIVSKNETDLALIGFETDKKNAYGRFLIENNSVKQIVEKNEAHQYTNLSDICNGGVMAVKTKHLWELLPKITNNNSKSEYYLTDIVELFNSNNLTCSYILENEKFVAGANTKEELSVLEKTFQKIMRKYFLQNGVQLIDPKTVYFSLDTKIEKDVIIYPNVFIAENVEIKANTKIHSFSHLEGCSVGENCNVGPFARLRPETILQNNVSVGNFVEIKKSTLAGGVKAGHLSYIGDAFVGENTNIGAGTITCNYNHLKQKHKTHIGSNVFVGSNTALVAPVSVANNTLIAAGSVITKDVPQSALAIARAKQVNIDNYKK